MKPGADVKLQPHGVRLASCDRHHLNRRHGNGRRFRPGIPWLGPSWSAGLLGTLPGVSCVAAASAVSRTAPCASFRTIDMRENARRIPLRRPRLLLRLYRLSLGQGLFDIFLDFAPAFQTKHLVHDFAVAADVKSRGQNCTPP